MKILFSLLIYLFILPQDPDPLRFKDDINQFKTEDMENPPGKNVILFVGSSSIRMWKSLKDDFPHYNVINRGFGGSHISDVIYYFDDIVKPYKPEKIIFYEGDNDLASGKSPDKVFDDLTRFCNMVEKELPGTSIAIIAAKPSPSRWELRDRYEQYNSLVAAYCSEYDDLTFIDIYRPMLTKMGMPKPELYLGDSLHMTEKGYKIWRKLILPFLNAK